jgi:acetyl esterase/lipase
MSQDTNDEPISKKAVVYRIPGMDNVKVRRDVAYLMGDAGDLTMDIYYPPDMKSEARMPTVVIVAGYPDPGFAARVGCKFKEMGSSVSWAQLMAASGMVAVTYTNREPAADLQALLQYVRQNAARLGIDENRIGLWAASGNVPLALSVLMQKENDYLKCAVLCYGIMLDLDESTIVADASKMWGFANPCAGKSVADLPPGLPLFIVRAGQDEMPHLNETIDSFMTKAVSCNLPVTFTNHPTATHAFDLFHDSETSHEIVRRILAFMQFHLLVAA